MTKKFKVVITVDDMGVNIKDKEFAAIHTYWVIFGFIRLIK